MKEMILLDSNSTNTVFCNGKYVNNFRNSKHILHFNSDGGTVITKKICDVPHLGTHWYINEAITNIISLADMTKNHQVTMDSDIEKSMILHLGKEKKVIFTQMDNWLYVRLSGKNKTT